MVITLLFFFLVFLLFYFFFLLMCPQLPTSFYFSIFSKLIFVCFCWIEFGRTRCPEAAILTKYSMLGVIKTEFTDKDHILGMELANPEN